MFLKNLLYSSISFFCVSFCISSASLSMLFSNAILFSLFFISFAFYFSYFSFFRFFFIIFLISLSLFFLLVFVFLHPLYQCYFHTLSFFHYSSSGLLYMFRTVLYLDLLFGLSLKTNHRLCKIVP